MNSFGAYLRSKRESKGMTVNQLGMYSEISAATISRIENGKRGVPKADTIKKLSAALRVPYNEMMKIAGYSDDANEEILIEETEIESINRETAKYLKLAKTVEQAKLIQNLAKEVFKNEKI